MKKLLLIVCLGLSTPSLFAADGSTGCGMGWYVAKENTLLSSAARFITHASTWPVSVLGMTFGTSNCAEHKIVLNEKRSLHYVTHNIHELKAEVAQGQGDYLQALNEVVGCHPASKQKLIEQLKSNYTEVFKEDRPESVLLNIYKTILKDEGLATSCILS